MHILQNAYPNLNGQTIVTKYVNFQKKTSFEELFISCFDGNKEIISFSDANPYGTFSIPLQQGKNHVLNVISYNSKSLIETE